jgi:hypothetical protein
MKSWPMVRQSAPKVRLPRLAHVARPQTDGKPRHRGRREALHRAFALADAVEEWHASGDTSSRSAAMGKTLSWQ